MKNLLLFLLKKAGVKLAGPLGWVASFLIEKIAIYLEKKLRQFFQYLKDSWEVKTKKQKDDKNAEKLKEVLESETKTESEIDNATSDFLNGR